MKPWILGPIPLLNHSVLKVKQSHTIILHPRHDFLRFCCIRTHFVCKEQDNSVVARGGPGRYWKVGGVGGWRGQGGGSLYYPNGQGKKPKKK